MIKKFLFMIISQLIFLAFIAVLRHLYGPVSYLLQLLGMIHLLS